MLVAFLLLVQRQQPSAFPINMQMWVSFGLLVLLVVFLIISFFATPRLTNDQRRTIKFLTALCAGAAGGFLIGGSILKFSSVTPIGNITISAAGACAFFLLVFLTYNKLFWASKITSGENGVSIHIPAGWTFQQVADAVSSSDRAGTIYKGFTDAEKDVQMRNQTVAGETQLDVLRTLIGLTLDGTIRPYAVEKHDGNYVLTIK